MIFEPETFDLPDNIPDELSAWRDGLARIQEADVPTEVISFINAIASKMPDFGRIRNDSVKMIGKDLLLAGLKEIKGQQIHPWGTYDFDVPVLVAADHRRRMLRLFNRKGKQGLIDYCKAEVKSTDLERVLSILEVSVFHNERPEFRRVMAQIQSAKKLENEETVRGI